MKAEYINLDEKIINELSKKLCSNDIITQANDYAKKNLQEYYDFYMQLDENKKYKLFVVCFGKKYGGVDIEGR